MTKSDAAIAMRNLPDDKRNELIATTDNCIDLRPKLRQKALASSYRSPNKPNGVA